MKHKKEQITNRVITLYVLFFVAALAIVAWILITQWGANGRALRESAHRQMYRTEEVQYVRGTIYASDGRTILACGSPFYNVYFDFGAVDESARRQLFTQNRAAMIDSLAAIFPRHPRAELAQSVDRVFNKVLSRERGYRYQKFVRDSVSQSQLDRLRALPIVADDGRILKTEKYQPRYRPFGTLARGTIGSDVWGTGIEQAYNQYLRGVNGSITKVRLYGQHYVPVNDRSNREVVNGCDVVTTLDVRMQDIVERELRAVMERSQGALGTGAIEGTAIVMHVSTGEIRALANLSRTDGGHFADIQNHAVTMRCEPGSTFKLVPLLALLEDGWDVSRVIDCGSGKYTDPHDNPVEDTHPVGRATIRQIFEQSSNIGFVKMVESQYDNNAQRYVDFIHGLGIDTTFSMGLSGAAHAIVKDPRIRAQNDLRRWDRGVSLMKMAYGYAVELTPMHTLTIYNAVANNGRMIEPILVREIRRDGRTVERFKARVIKKHICSDKTLRFVQECLEGVIANGTGRGAHSDRYRVAGKTGTAQVAQPGIGYRDRNGGTYYLASFVGYLPADKPEYTIIVAVKTYWRAGTGAKRYGAEFGVPVFKAMADQIFSTFTERETPSTPRTLPDTVAVKGGRAAEITLLAQQFGLTVDADGNSQGWLLTSLTGTAVATRETELTTGIMPNVAGMGLKDALYILEKQGLKVHPTGYGAVVSQTPQAGEPITEGQEARIELRIEN